jgi:RimJ/RimL family protein N-acetyltransferase
MLFKRNDIEGAEFLNKQLAVHSSFKYNEAMVYTSGEPINFAVAFYNYKELENGSYEAEASICSNGFYYNKKIIKEVLSLFFENKYYNVNRLIAFTSPRNKQAIRLLELFGFKLEGILRQVAKNNENRLLYSILREDYGRNI